MFTSSLRSHIFKSDNISGKIRQCVTINETLFKRANSCTQAFFGCKEKEGEQLGNYRKWARHQTQKRVVNR